MINIYGLVKKNIHTIFLSLFSLFIFLPTFSIRFSWIDDGWDILVAKNLIQNLIHLDIGAVLGSIIESSIGRFRPIYWLWQTLVYLLGGANSTVHYVLHYLLILSIVILIYKLILLFTKSNTASLLGSLVFLTFPLNSDNWVRLGPAEPLMAFFVLLSIFVYFKSQNVKLSVIFMLLAFLTKETAIAVVPSFIFFVLIKLLTSKIIKKEINIAIYFIILGVMSITISMLNRKGYSNFYVFDLNTAKYNFVFYLNLIRNVFPIYLLFIVTFLLRNIRPIVNYKFKSIKDLEILKLFFLSSFLAFILIQSPWAWVLNRYLMPALAMGSIFLGLEIYSIQNFLKKYPKILITFNLFFYLYIVCFVVYSSISIKEQIVRQKHSSENIYQIIKLISEKTPQNGKVYWNFKDNDATMEPLFEADIHLKLFFNRNDIKVDFIENLKPKDKNYLIVSGTPLGSFKEIDDSKLKTDKRLIKYDSYTNQSKFIVISNFNTVVKQLTKKIINVAKGNGKIDNTGIYTDYLLKDDWRIYYY